VSTDDTGPAVQKDPDQSRLVVMYCRSWCGDCMRARRWLEQRGIPYVEVDVEEDDTARGRAAALNDGRLHTPTFEIGADVCVDFRPELLERLLELE